MEVLGWAGAGWGGLAVRRGEVEESAGGERQLWMGLEGRSDMQQVNAKLALLFARLTQRHRTN